MKDYILLEKERYDNRLDIMVDFPDQTGGYFIAPLLLLPFVENCFKYGTSTMIEQPWIHIVFTMQEGKLIMKMVNGKLPGSTNKLKYGIGINNVKQRLALLYLGKYALQLFNEDDMFIVNLKLELDCAPLNIASAVPLNTTVYGNF